MAYDRKDHYHQRAKREGYRSRAAFKLAEFQKAHRVMKRGEMVVDLGCWPGGWLQIASESVGPTGRVVGLDMAPIEPALENANVFALQGDLLDSAAISAVKETLGRRADVLLSDAAPKLTGVRATDRAREEALLEAVEAALPQLLEAGGILLVKLLDCPEAADFQKRTRSRFESAKVVKPAASRKGTTEKYLLAKGLRP